MLFLRFCTICKYTLTLTIKQQLTQNRQHNTNFSLIHKIKTLVVFIKHKKHSKIFPWNCSTKYILVNESHTMDAVLCLAQDNFSYLVQISKNKTSYFKIIKHLVKKITLYTITKNTFYQIWLNRF